MSTSSNGNELSLLNQIFGGGTPRKALAASLIVGTVLTAINHGDVILAGQVPEIHKVALTFCVPYLVATWGAVSEKRSRTNYISSNAD